MSPRQAARDRKIPNDPTVVLAADLIGKASITPSDEGCQDLIQTRLSAAGFRCESLKFGKVSNLWARYGTTAPLLCLAGHTDVVPPGDPDHWHSDPFTATFHEGHLFGRGAADMKGSLAALITAAERFVARNANFAGSIAFLITSDEEGVAVDGTRKVIDTLVARGENIDFCLVGEPSSAETLGDTIRIGRRGSLTGSLAITGLSGHVAYADLAKNPIREFAPVLAELCAIEWDQGNQHFPPTTFELVHVDSSSGADNVIPAALRAKFNFRYSTEWSAIALQDKIAAILNAHDIEHQLDWHLSGEPYLTTPGRLTEAAVRSIREIANVETTFSTGGGTSDGRFIAPFGAEVIELGLINASIHQPNENTAVEHLLLISRVYERIMHFLFSER